MHAGFTCECKSGYHKPHGYPNLSYCIPTTCPDGHKFDVKLGTCKDIDECNEGQNSK